MTKNSTRLRDDFLVFGALIIEDAEILEVIASMKSGWLGICPEIAPILSDFNI